MGNETSSRNKEMYYDTNRFPLNGVLFKYKGVEEEQQKHIQDLIARNSALKETVARANSPPNVLSCFRHPEKFEENCDFCKYVKFESCLTYFQKIIL